MSQALKSSGLSSIASLAGLGGISKRTSVDLARDLLKDRSLLDTISSGIRFSETLRPFEESKDGSESAHRRKPAGQV